MLGKVQPQSGRWLVSSRPRAGGRLQCGSPLNCASVDHLRSSCRGIRCAGELLETPWRRKGGSRRQGEPSDRTVGLIPVKGSREEGS